MDSRCTMDSRCNLDNRCTMDIPNYASHDDVYDDGHDDVRLKTEKNVKKLVSMFSLNFLTEYSTSTHKIKQYSYRCDGHGCQSNYLLVAGCYCYCYYCCCCHHCCCLLVHQLML